MEITDSLLIIPARGGSKKLPRKNILPLAGKPLIYYTIDAARGVSSDQNICVSSDDNEIIKIVEEYGLEVFFIRPSQLASDTASSEDVILHSLDFFEKNLNQKFEKIILLQPTSPFRESAHLFDAYSLWEDDLDMLVSVKKSKSNPYFNLFEESADGYLCKSKNGTFTRRQDCPDVYEFNGAIYIIKTESIRKKHLDDFKKIKKYVMDEYSSIDIDSINDFLFAELIMDKRKKGFLDR